MPERVPAHVRFERLFIPEPNTGCWLWLGSLDKDGYAKFSNEQQVTVRAARWIFVRVRGGIPPAHVLDHHCRTRCCVNPDHVEPVTNAVNTLRGESFAAVNARKTHCVRGHLLDGENLAAWDHERRTCRVCRNMRKARTTRVCETKLGA